MTSLRHPLLLAAAVLATAALSSAQVVINEIYYDAPGGDDGQVFVEIYGPAGFDVSGYQLQSIEGAGGAASTCNPQLFTFPAGTQLPADGILVVADTDGSGVTQVANADFLSSNFDLENGADALQLLDASGALVDAVAYGAVDTTIVASQCNGLAWFEGNPARDVFAPLSIERCPAGIDTGDNDSDLVANVPTPGVASTCCKAMEWLNLGNGSSISASSGAVGFDFFLSPCGANQNFLVLAAITDPATTTPPLGLPVFDGTTSLWITAAAVGGPFVGWSGTLGADARSVGQTRLDFSNAPVTVGVAFQMWIGAISYDAFLNINGTNAVTVTINP
jgi:hypothetical protein